jgi:hypothetical protein
LKVIPDWSPDKLDRYRNRIEKLFSAALIDYFTKQLSKAIRLKTDYRPDENELRILIVPYLAQAATTGSAWGTARIMMHGITPDWPDIQHLAVTYARQHSFELVRGINETTQRQLQSKLAYWIEDEGTPAELRESLTPLFGETRANTIAITETTFAYEKGKVQAWKEINRQLGRELITGRKWLTVNDERTCAICAPLGGLVFTEDGAQPTSYDEQAKDSQIAGLNTDFVHPGGPGIADKFAGQTYEAPPAHPNCRCRTVEVML